jgi:hypothetical protein
MSAALAKLKISTKLQLSFALIGALGVLLDLADDGMRWVVLVILVVTAIVLPVLLTSSIVTPLRTLRAPSCRSRRATCTPPTGWTPPARARSAS